MPPASSYGRDSARICAYCRGYSSAAPGAPRPWKRQSDTCRARRTWTPPDLGIDAADLAELMAVPRDAWRQEIAELRTYLQGYGSHLPAALVTELDGLEHRLV